MDGLSPAYAALTEAQQSANFALRKGLQVA